MVDMVVSFVASGVFHEVQVSLMAASIRNDRRRDAKKVIVAVVIFDYQWLNPES